MSTQARRQKRRATDDGEEDERGARSQQNRQQQRQRRRPAEEADIEEDENEEEEDDDDNDDERVSHTQANRQQFYTHMMAKKLIRYALSCEPRRLPIRRQAVKEQVLDNEGKYFRSVFPIAQEQLRAIFGMQMVEWPSRDETTMNVRERRKALKTQKPASTSARADRFVLVSTLPDAYRASVFASISPSSQGQQPASQSSSSQPIPPLPPAPDAAYMGFVTMVIALITLGGGALPHADLEKYLSSLYGNSRHVPFRADAELLPIATAMGDHMDDGDGGTGGTDPTQDSSESTQGGTLQYLVRQGYVVRVVEAPSAAEARAGGGGGSGGGGGGGGGGSRSVGADASKVTWHIGPRARLEVGTAEVAAVVRHIYGPAAGEDFERRLQSSLHSEKKDQEEPSTAANEEDESSREEAQDISDGQ